MDGIQTLGFISQMEKVFLRTTTLDMDHLIILIEDGLTMIFMESYIVLIVRQRILM